MPQARAQPAPASKSLLYLNFLIKPKSKNICRENQEDNNSVTDEQINVKKTEIFKINDELDDAISGLDKQLDDKLKKQEHDYLKGYSMYVKQKE